MAKRFTDTEKWNKRFIRSLKPAYKILWLYILDECNHAGMWDVDLEVAQLKTGMKFTEKEAIESFGDKIVLVDAGAKWFIPAFIDFQYGTLSENNRAHQKSIALLKKFKLIGEDLKPLASPLQAPTQGAKVLVEVEVMAEAEVKDKGGVGENSETAGKLELVYPFESDSFKELWGHWKQYRRKLKDKFQYATIQSEQAALNELAEVSRGDEPTAVAIVMKSMGRGWKGFFEPKNNNNGQSNSNNWQQPNSQQADLHSAFSKIDAMYSSDGQRGNEGGR